MSASRQHRHYWGHRRRFRYLCYISATTGQAGDGGKQENQLICSSLHAESNVTFRSRWARTVQGGLGRFGNGEGRDKSFDTVNLYYNQIASGKSACVAMLKTPAKISVGESEFILDQKTVLGWAAVLLFCCGHNVPVSMCVV
jgi:hypothetical protein